MLSHRATQGHTGPHRATQGLTGPHEGHSWRGVASPPLLSGRTNKLVNRVSFEQAARVLVPDPSRVPPRHPPLAKAMPRRGRAAAHHGDRAPAPAPAPSGMPWPPARGAVSSCAADAIPQTPWLHVPPPVEHGTPPLARGTSLWLPCPAQRSLSYVCPATTARAATRSMFMDCCSADPSYLAATAFLIMLNTSGLPHTASLFLAPHTRWAMK